MSPLVVPPHVASDDKPTATARATPTQPPTPGSSSAAKMMAQLALAIRQHGSAGAKTADGSREAGNFRTATPSSRPKARNRTRRFKQPEAQCQAALAVRHADDLLRQRGRSPVSRRALHVLEWRRRPETTHRQRVADDRAVAERKKFFFSLSKRVSFTLAVKQVCVWFVKDNTRQQEQQERQEQQS
jgi:hypothetical protein